MNSAKKGIRHLAAICSMKGITHAVISPGSRNAPIIAAFLQEKKIKCLSIPDERSAAFFALGIAQQSRNTVAIICTSGSAVLNYAPAIAEAFYQKIPLLVITADRPNEWIDQGENQSIHQYRIYQNFIRKSVELPVDPETEKDIWYSDRLISEAINATRIPEAGPVHVNVPLREPLYDMIEVVETEVPKIIEAAPFEPALHDSDREK
jgi:2-succinyl-5-enolpyruvyl-6-hydroxy-3-cyclohexene-1-carboxylate synthase